MPTLVNAHLFYNSHSNRYIMMSHCGLGRHFLMSSNAGQFVMRVLAICIHFWRTVCSNGEGNGTPLQYSFLENSRDGGAWWAAVYGVAQSRTQLKRLSSSSSSMEKQYGGFKKKKKTENRTTIRSCSFTSGYISKGNEITIVKR